MNKLVAAFILILLLSSCGGVEYKPEYIPVKCDYGWILGNDPDLGAVCARTKENQEFVAGFNSRVCYKESGITQKERIQCQKYAQYEGLKPYDFNNKKNYKNNSKSKSVLRTIKSPVPPKNPDSEGGVANFFSNAWDNLNTQAGQNSWDTKLYRLGEALSNMGTPYSQRGVSPSYRWMADEPNSGFSYSDYNRMSEQNKTDRKIKELEKQVKDSTFGYMSGNQMYSKSNKYMGYIKNSNLYNKHNQKTGYIRGNGIYSNSGKYLGYTR